MYKLLCLALFGLVASSMGAAVSGEDAPANSELAPQDEGPEISEDDSSDEVAERGIGACHCDNISCQCCVTPKLPKVGRIPICLRVVIQANQKSVGLQATAKGKMIINAAYHIGARDSKCAAVPGSWNAVKGCVDTDTSMLPGNAGVQTCPRFQVKTVGATVATLILPCVQLANRRVSFNNRGEVKTWEHFKLKFF